MQKLPVLIFLFSLIISITIGYPAIFSTDEWISASQLNHLVSDNSLLTGFDRYGSSEYSTSHQNMLVYTLALPVLSLPAYYLFALFQDSFRMFVIFLNFLLIASFLFLFRLFYPQYSSWRGIPWIYGAFGLNVVLLVFNILLFSPFIFSDSILAYPEVAAIVFTNEIAFAISAVITFLIFKEIFNSDTWGIFGLTVLISGSSYLFWSGNAKDHIFAILFGIIAGYLYILFLKKKNHLILFSSFIAIGWLAWVRPELGLTTALGFFILVLFFSIRKGLKFVLISICSGFGVIIGAVPLFLNNYGLMGNPLLPPAAILFPASGEQGGNVASITQSYYSTGTVDWISSLFGIFIAPFNGAAAGIFQVAPLSIFAIIFGCMIIYSFLRTSHPTFEGIDPMIIVFCIIWILVICFAYIRSFADLPFSAGISPDIRYLAPMYLPLLILGLYSFRCIGFNEDSILISLKTFIVLIIVDLPLCYVIYQMFWGMNWFEQVKFNLIVTGLFLAATIMIFIFVFIKKISVQWFAYSIPAVMVSSLIWEVITDFRFATFVWEGYHFWIPVVQYLWYVQYILFPL